MMIKPLSATQTLVGGCVLIEEGPQRRREVATAEILSDRVTAAHYFAGERELPAGPAVVAGGRRPKKSDQPKTAKRVGVDAKGRPIKIGEPFEFIDWLNPVRVFWIYVRDGEGRWIHADPDQAPTRDEAINVALGLVQQQGLEAQ